MGLAALPLADRRQPGSQCALKVTQRPILSLAPTPLPIPVVVAIPKLLYRPDFSIVEHLISPCRVCSPVLTKSGAAGP